MPLWHEGVAVFVGGQGVALNPKVFGQHTG